MANYLKDMELIESLPDEVAREVLDTLKYFTECYVTFQYGKFEVSTGIGIYSRYAPDHKFWGSAKANNIYSPQMQREFAKRA